MNASWRSEGFFWPVPLRSVTGKYRASLGQSLKRQGFRERDGFYLGVVFDFGKIVGKELGSEYAATHCRPDAQLCGLVAVLFTFTMPVT